MVKFHHNEWLFSWNNKKNTTSQGQSKEQFDAKEQVIIREAKQANAREFLEKIKAPRRAVVTESERKIIGRISQHELFRWSNQRYGALYFK